MTSPPDWTVTPLAEPPELRIRKAPDETVTVLARPPLWTYSVPPAAITDFVTDPGLLGNSFAGDSWLAAQVILQGYLEAGRPEVDPA